MHYVFAEYGVNPEAEADYAAWWRARSAGQPESNVRLVRSSEQAGLHLEIWTFPDRESADRCADELKERHADPRWSAWADLVTSGWKAINVWRFESAT